VRAEQLVSAQKVQTRCTLRGRGGEKTKSSSAAQKYRGTEAGPLCNKTLRAMHKSRGEELVAELRGGGGVKKTLKGGLPGFRKAGVHQATQAAKVEVTMRESGSLFSRKEGVLELLKRA